MAPMPYLRLRAQGYLTGSSPYSLPPRTKPISILRVSLAAMPVGLAPAAMAALSTFSASACSAHTSKPSSPVHPLLLTRKALAPARVTLSLNSRGLREAAQSAPRALMTSTALGPCRASMEKASVRSSISTLSPLRSASQERCDFILSLAAAFGTASHSPEGSLYHISSSMTLACSFRARVGPLMKPSLVAETTFVKA